METGAMAAAARAVVSEDTVLGGICTMPLPLAFVLSLVEPACVLRVALFPVSSFFYVFPSMLTCGARNSHLHVLPSVLAGLWHR